MDYFGAAVFFAIQSENRSQQSLPAGDIYRADGRWFRVGVGACSRPPDRGNVVRFSFFSFTISFLFNQSIVNLKIA
jgi:hypothetical protein